MPHTWPKVLNKKDIKDCLDYMAETPIFLDLCIALMSDPFWYCQYMTFGALDASIILAKQILHSTYEFDGSMKKDLVFFLNYSVGPNDMPLQPGDERYAQNHDIKHFYGSRLDGIYSLNVWQCIQILIKRSIYKFDLECASRFAASDIEAFHSIAEDSQEFINTNAFHFDALGFILRSAMCITNLIQKLHLEFMVHHGNTAPPKFTGFKRCTEGLNLNSKLKDSKKNQIWSNYLFDVAAMWMIVRRFHESLMDSDSKDFVHSCGKARLWSLTTGLAESAKYMTLISNSDIMQKIMNCATALHFLYLRLWQHALPAMQNHKSVLCLQRCMARLSSQVFLKSDETIKIDFPDCGTGALLDNSFQHTFINPEYLGLVYENNAIFGILPEDLHYSFFTGFISAAVTQSTEHLWVSVRHPQSWIGQIDQGLASTDNYLKIEKWIQCSWCYYDILQDQYREFRKSHYKNHEKMQNEEIESILKNI